MFSWSWTWWGGLYRKEALSSTSPHRDGLLLLNLILTRGVTIIVSNIKVKCFFRLNKYQCKSVCQSVCLSSICRNSLYQLYKPYQTMPVIHASHPYQSSMPVIHTSHPSCHFQKIATVSHFRLVYFSWISKSSEWIFNDSALFCIHFRHGPCHGNYVYKQIIILVFFSILSILKVNASNRRNNSIAHWWCIAYIKLQIMLTNYHI